MTVQHYKITAPERLFSGVVANVRFHQGVATLSVDPDAPRPDGATRNPAAVTALAYFRRKAYEVEEIDSPSEVDRPEGPVGTPNGRVALEATVLGLTGDQGATQPPAAPPTPPNPNPGDGDGEKSDGSEVKPPAKSASKADWLEFAVNHRKADRDEADKLTRDQLADQYSKEA
ncbi:hypothetical protein [Saccharothrix sp. HUAS TT1]|uniref:hypothetical protein n=1 Tax=unclassified Saccharothrix TaxID=2593673 RepID=UPI00345B561D